MNASPFTAIVRPGFPFSRRTARDTAIVAGRNLRHFRREPQIIVFSTVQPVLLVLLFNFVFGGAIESVLPPGTQYIQFVIPGILIQTVAFGTAQTAVGVAQDFQGGMVERFRSLPMDRSAVLGGRVVADALRLMFTAAIVTAVGYLLGFRFQESFASGAAAYGFILLFGITFSWIAVTIGMFVRNAEAAQAAGFTWLFPLVFASSAFVSIETFTPWLRDVSSVSPVTIYIDSIRALLLDDPAYAMTWELAWQAAAWAAGILAVFIPLAVYRYQRAT